MSWIPYKGQKIVCIGAHSRGIINIGQEYTIFGIMYCCGCGAPILDVGIVGDCEYGLHFNA